MEMNFGDWQLFRGMVRRHFLVGALALFTSWSKIKNSYCLLFHTDRKKWVMGTLSRNYPFINNSGILYHLRMFIKLFTITHTLLTLCYCKNLWSYRSLLSICTSSCLFQKEARQHLIIRHLVLRLIFWYGDFIIRIRKMAPVSQPGAQSAEPGLKSLTHVTGSASADVCLCS